MDTKPAEIDIAIAYIQYRLNDWKHYNEGVKHLNCVSDLAIEATFGTVLEKLKDIKAHPDEYVDRGTKEGWLKID